MIKLLKRTSASFSTIALMSAVMVGVWAQDVFAQETPPPKDTGKIDISAKDLNLDGAPTSVNSSSVEGILMTVYFIAGIVAVIAIIIGGIRYAASGGDSSGIQSAKNTILYAVVGLVVIIMAAAITSFVLNNAT